MPLRRVYSLTLEGFYDSTKLRIWSEKDLCKIADGVLRQTMEHHNRGFVHGRISAHRIFCDVETGKAMVLGFNKHSMDFRASPSLDLQYSNIEQVHMMPPDILAKVALMRSKHKPLAVDALYAAKLDAYAIGTTLWSLWYGQFCQYLLAFGPLGLLLWEDHCERETLEDNLEKFSNDSTSPATVDYDTAVKRIENYLMADISGLPLEQWHVPWPSDFPAPSPDFVQLVHMLMHPDTQRRWSVGQALQFLQSQAHSQAPSGSNTTSLPQKPFAAVGQPASSTSTHLLAVTGELRGPALPTTLASPFATLLAQQMGAADGPQQIQGGTSDGLYTSVSAESDLEGLRRSAAQHPDSVGLLDMTSAHDEMLGDLSSSTLYADEASASYHAARGVPGGQAAFLQNADSEQRSCHGAVHSVHQQVGWQEARACGGLTVASSSSPRPTSSAFPSSYGAATSASPRATASSNTAASPRCTGSPRFTTATSSSTTNGLWPTISSRSMGSSIAAGWEDRGLHPAELMMMLDAQAAARQEEQERQSDSLGGRLKGLLIRVTSTAESAMSPRGSSAPSSPRFTDSRRTSTTSLTFPASPRAMAASSSPRRTRSPRCTSSPSYSYASPRTTQAPSSPRRTSGPTPSTSSPRCSTGNPRIPATTTTTTSATRQGDKPRVSNTKRSSSSGVAAGPKSAGSSSHPSPQNTCCEVQELAPTSWAAEERGLHPAELMMVLESQASAAAAVQEELKQSPGLGSRLGGMLAMCTGRSAAGVDCPC